MFQSNPLELVWLLFQLVVMVSLAIAIGTWLIQVLRTRSSRKDQAEAIYQDMLRTQRFDRTYQRPD